MIDGRFYVTVVREGGGARRVGFLLGPFLHHASALEAVAQARRIAGDIDPRTAFDLFGTARVASAPYPPGVLNEGAVL